MARTVRIMERRKLYNRVPVPLPSTTRWRHSDSVREGNCLNLEESLSFADSLLQSHEERAEDSIYLEDQAATLLGIMDMSAYGYMHTMCTTVYCFQCVSCYSTDTVTYPPEDLLPSSSSADSGYSVYHDGKYVIINSTYNNSID